MRRRLRLPNWVATAEAELTGTPVRVAAVATGFPAGQVPLEVKLADTRRAVADGADEIDMVIDRGAFLSGDFDAVYDEIGAVKQACGDAHLKVILETGELETLDNVRRASDLAIRAMDDVIASGPSSAGGNIDFIKTSTGKVQPAATMPVRGRISRKGVRRMPARLFRAGQNWSCSTPATSGAGSE